MYTLESQDSDSRGVIIQGYLPEAVLSNNKLHPNSGICYGDCNSSVRGGRAQKDPDQDQEIFTASSCKQILFAWFIFNVGLNIKEINILYAVDKNICLQELGSAV